MHNVGIHDPKGGITLPTTPILASDDDIGAIDDWLDSVKRAGRSSQTIRTYRAGLEKFTDWLRDNGRSAAVEAVERRDVQRWVDALADEGLKPATIAIYYRAVSLFFEWAADDEELIERNPARKVKRPTVRPPDEPVLSEDQIDALLRAARGRTFEARRNFALIRFMLDTGARRGEVEAMTVDDLDLDSQPDGTGIAAIRESKTLARVVPFSAETADAIRAYLKLRRKRRAAKASDRLWLGKVRPMSGEIIRRIIGELGQRAGIDGLHPHLLRHTWAHTALADDGMKEGDIMALGGWKNRAMLDRYGANKKAERALAAGLARFRRMAAT